MPGPEIHHKMAEVNRFTVQQEKGKNYIGNKITPCIDEDNGGT